MLIFFRYFSLGELKYSKRIADGPSSLSLQSLVPQAFRLQSPLASAPLRSKRMYSQAGVVMPQASRLLIISPHSVEEFAGLVKVVVAWLSLSVVVDISLA